MDAVIKDDDGEQVNILALSNELNVKGDQKKLELAVNAVRHGQTIPGAPFPEVVDNFYTLRAVCVFCFLGESRVSCVPRVV